MNKKAKNKITELSQRVQNLERNINRLSEQAAQKPTVQIKPTDQYDRAFDLPKYETSGAAGMDLRAMVLPAFKDLVQLQPGSVKMFGTGIKVNIPPGHHGRITLRSSMYRTGVRIPHSVGVIDSDYRGELKIPLISTVADIIEKGQRIAQMTIHRCQQAEIIVVDRLNATERGEGVFGSTD